MLAKFTYYLAAFLSVLFLCFHSFILNAQENMLFARDRIIVKFKDGLIPNYIQKNGFAQFSITEIDDLDKKLSCISAKRIYTGKKRKNSSFVYVLNFDYKIDVNSTISEYTASGYFEFAEPDNIAHLAGTTTVLPDDQYFSRQWYLHNDGTFPFDSALAGADIKMCEAWDIEQGDSSVIVAVIDGGARLNHPEFLGRIWKNPNYAADSLYYPFDSVGWNFALHNNNPTDLYGHGTNVTGIIGANGNNVMGYAGVDWNCKLMILDVVDSNQIIAFTWMAEAIFYATDHDAKVINMSIESLATPPALLQDAINYAYDNGVTIIACMGNYDTSLLSIPARYTHVIAVGATNDHDVRVSPFPGGGGSEYGPNISVVAPGNIIYGLSYNSNNYFDLSWCGTSMAAPIVSGLAALLLAQDPSRTPDQIRHIIESTADDTVGNRIEDIPGWDQYYGYGRVNALRALTYYQHEQIQSLDAEYSKIDIYPNPSTGKLYIDVIKKNDSINYCVINLLGKVVTQGSFKNCTCELDLSANPKGTYILMLNNYKKYFSRTVIIK